MHLDLLLRGIVVGFVLALPVGPVAAICIRRALVSGALIAFATSVSAALADAVIGVVAAYGISFVSGFMESHRMLLRLVGGAFLIGLGVFTWRAAGHMKEPKPMNQGSTLREFAAIFLLSVSNPATLLSAMGTTAAVGSFGSRDAYDVATLAAGIVIGSSFWWVVLSAGAGTLRNFLSPRWLLVLDHALGVVLVIGGAAILVDAVVVGGAFGHLGR